MQSMQIEYGRWQFGQEREDVLMYGTVCRRNKIILGGSYADCFNDENLAFEY